jgi:hypothetical protein
MITSLLNAAGWKNYLLGSINAGSGALVVTDGAFTADDVGKKVAIDGAGAGGGIYEGVITAVADATHVTVAPAVVTTVVGATVSFGGRLNDDRRNLFELREAAFQADEAHYLPLAETTGHWLRPELLTLSAGVAHAAELGTIIPRIGPLGRVFIRVHPLGSYEPGTRAEAEEIRRMRANTGIAPNDVYGSLAHNVAGSQIGGFFWMPADENTVQYTGDSLKVYYVPTYTRGTDLKSPEIFTGSIASFAVARLLAKEGAKTPAHATVHGTYGEAVLGGIRANEQKIPASVEEFQQEHPPARAA